MSTKTRRLHRARSHKAFRPWWWPLGPYTAAKTIHDAFANDVIWPRMEMLAKAINEQLAPALKGLDVAAVEARFNVEDLRAAADKIKNAPMPAPCGSRDRPHVMAPHHWPEGPCINCGWHG